MILEDLLMAVRIMLPSKARVGDTIHFAFPKAPGKVVTGFEVTINGQKMAEPEILASRAQSKEATIFVYRVTEPGTYQFKITPIGQEGERGEPRLNTLEVTT